MKLSLSEQLILGILSEQARHGYDIEKIIIERGMRKWAVVGFSSIYYVLERLEEKGLATGDDTQGNEKKQYSITIENMPQSARRLLELGETLLEAELRWINKELERTKQ